MEQKEFGRSGKKVSLLGFGCMRLPILNGEESNINEPLATQMLRLAIDGGVNYIDTAYPYHQEKSEPFVGRALSDGYREKVFLATKSPVWKVEKREDFDRFLDEQLSRLQTSWVDMYLLHALHRKSWEKIQNLGALDFLQEKIQQGKIRYAGFSFHDEREVFMDILEAFDWDFCQIQLNYMDTEYQAGLKGYEAARSKGMGIVIMEPLKGGKLANIHPQSQQSLKRVHPDWSPARWAFQWLQNLPGVSTILSGMSTMAQVKENLDTFATTHPFTQTEHDAIAEVQEKLASLKLIDCTGCRYCMPCPENVAIPEIFSFYNNVELFNALGESQWAYNKMLKPEQRATSCVECGQCESKCPQNLAIPSLLRKAHETLFRE
ncbi:MAG TPA: aldo/keto reductase [Thermotogota bacterium]|nr:aldo/keto reductase [Thermotogota bacterium]HRW91838.1 aldo/keto reductase [Thermotogota bacterium]